MKRATGPVVKDVVLIGAGHAHVQVLRRFGMEPLEGVRFTLITREVHTPYSGMLPGLVAGHYSFDEAHIDSGPLCRFAGARLYQDEVTGIDLAGKRILCRGRPAVPYDVLSIDIGSTPNTAAVPGAAEHCIPVKPIDGFLARFENMLRRVRDRPGKTRIAVVGSGAGGVELMLSVAQRIRDGLAAAGLAPEKAEFVLVAGSQSILPKFPPAFRQRFERLFAHRNIDVVLGSRVAEVGHGSLRLEDGRQVEADEILWTTQAAAPRWLRDTGLTLDPGGFISVDSRLRAVGHTDVFAAGDVASFIPRALPKSGVYAVRAGPVLADNIRRLLTGSELRPFRPQADAMYIVSTGDAYAVGTKWGIAFAGASGLAAQGLDRPQVHGPVQRASGNGHGRPWPCIEARGQSRSPGDLGDRNALRRMRRQGGLHRPDASTWNASPLRARRRAGRARRAGRCSGRGYWRETPERAHGRLFPQHRRRPYIFGKIAANHALGDIFAMGAEPQSALAIATVPYGLEFKVEADLSAMMAGANEILAEVGCALVGGHTSEGAELSLGFAVNGLVERDRFLRKGGMQPGDALVLTKPIGTGTLLAADMRGKAKGRWVMKALAHMTQSNRRAAEVLSLHGVHAATDVTGFGLLGHLVEMTKASGVDAEIDLDAIPVLEGARETVASGVFSSLQPQNVRLRRAIRDLEVAALSAGFPLLFDPQTAGGLLASLPEANAAACVSALRDGGLHRGKRHRPNSRTVRISRADLGDHERACRRHARSRVSDGGRTIIESIQRCSPVPDGADKRLHGVGCLAFPDTRDLLCASRLQPDPCGRQLARRPGRADRAERRHLGHPCPDRLHVVRGNAVEASALLRR